MKNEYRQNQFNPKKIKLLHAERLIERLNHSISRQKNKPNRFVIDNEYVEKGYLAYLPSICTKLYCALLLHCNTKTQTAFPGIERLQELSGEKNRNSLITAINILEDYRIIVVHRSIGGSYKSNLYQFVSSKEWLPIEKARGKMSIVSYQQRYQKTSDNCINNPEENSGNIDTLTRSSSNYIKDITTQIDFLSKKMQIGSGLAIHKPSGDTVDMSKNTDKIYQNETVNTVKKQFPEGGVSKVQPCINITENCINIDTVQSISSVDNTTQKQREDDNIKSAYEH